MKGCRRLRAKGNDELGNAGGVVRGRGLALCVRFVKRTTGHLYHLSVPGERQDAFGTKLQGEIQRTGSGLLSSWRDVCDDQCDCEGRERAKRPTTSMVNVLSHSRFFSVQNVRLWMGDGNVPSGEKSKNAGVREMGDFLGDVARGLIQ
jgi:hypothetical protein